MWYDKSKFYLPQKRCMKNPIFQRKKGEHDKVIKNLSLPQNKLIWILHLADTNTIKKITEGLKTLPVSFIIYGKWKNEGSIVYQEEFSEDILIGADFLIADSHTTDLEKYMKAGVTPIISKSNYLSSLLSEFNPIKNEGNAFIYEQDNEWQIFYALCRYLENSKFSFDNQNLVNNVTKI